MAKQKERTAIRGLIIPKTTNALKTGIYVRVSTDEQAQEGFSVRGQTEKLKAYALLKEWDIYDIYVDEGISGKNIVDRPEINRLIDDINDGNVNNVLVFRVDRLTRSTKNLIELVELFESNDCTFNSLTESIDTDTPSGRMFLKIIGIFAEFERENLAVRLKLGLERKAKEGYTLANYSISYGYDKETGQKVQSINQDEAKIVREIFDRYVNENMTMGRIATNLNERRVKTKRGNIAWDANKIKKILTNPTYTGKVRYALRDEKNYFEADGQHEAIISDELFALAQEKIERMPRHNATKQPLERNYFCGVLYCSECGSKFSTHQHDKRRGDYQSSYKCANKKYYKSDIASCTVGSVVRNKVEQAFVEYIEKIGNLKEPVNINLAEETAKQAELSARIADFESQLERTKKKKNQVLEQYMNEEIDFAEYKQMVQISDEKYYAIENELIKAQTMQSTEEQAATISQEDIILNLKENWAHLDNKERMMFLQKFINKIQMRVEKDGRLNTPIIEEIEFNLTGKVIDKKRMERQQTHLR